jgi:hypothetical protein
MKEEPPSLFTSPGFLIALFLLLVNDFFLKSYLHNSLTGKLSDFAGLFVFPLFWISFFPRFRSWVYLATAGVFIFWKSPASAALIDSWNGFGLFSVGRTVDYYDLIALTVLPFSYIYGLKAVGLIASRAVPALIAVASMFAFTATSFSHKTQYDKEFQFAVSKQELIKRMSRLPQHDVSQYFWESKDFEVTFESCLEAKFSVTERDQQSVLLLTETNYRCPSPPEKDQMLRTFEQEFIAKLSDNRPAMSPEINYIWGVPDFSSPSPSVSPSLKKPPGKSITR